MVSGFALLHTYQLSRATALQAMQMFRRCLVVFRAHDGDTCHKSMVWEVPVDLRDHAVQAKTYRINVFGPDEGMTNNRLGLCSACGADAKLSVCGGCKMHGYCSRACQLQLWPSHRALCRNIRQARQAGDAGTAAASASS